MPMNHGDFSCPTEDGDDYLCTADGMTADIYAALQLEFDEDVKDLEPKDLKTIHAAWCRLARAVAIGVIGHITNNMDITHSDNVGIPEGEPEVEITIAGPSAGVTGDPKASTHTHDVGLDFPRADVSFV